MRELVRSEEEEEETRLMLGCCWVETYMLLSHFSVGLQVRVCVIIEELTASAARRALSLVTSSTVPWISTRSTFWFRSSMTPSRMAWTSASLFLLPVMKLRCLGTDAEAIFGFFLGYLNCGLALILCGNEFMIGVFFQSCCVLSVNNQALKSQIMCFDIPSSRTLIPLIVNQRLENFEMTTMAELADVQV